jgi:hypothetical protein
LSRLGDVLTTIAKTDRSCDRGFEMIMMRKRCSGLKLKESRCREQYSSTVKEHAAWRRDAGAAELDDANLVPLGVDT